MRFPLRLRSLFLSVMAATSLAGAVDPADTRLLAEPAVSASRIAFTYDRDLWVVERSGGSARRLTTAPGAEYGPSFSPDGKWLTFTGNYDGNTDVYLIPAEGGEPRRLTWHPGWDDAVGFTPDGERVLFVSQRGSHTTNWAQLYTVPLTGGTPTRLPIPTAFDGSYSPDGRRVAYTPLHQPYRQWKHYRGGLASRVLITDLATLATEQVPKPEGGCNDAEPFWIGDALYFISDRDGEFNLYRYQAATRAVERLTRFDDFPVRTARGGAGVVIFEQAGWLHLFEPGSGATRRLQIAVPSDLRETRPRLETGEQWVRSVSLAPEGKRAVVEYRGEIVTVPAEKGEPRAITRSNGVHDRNPVWSPDGRQIAWFSDQSGEYGLQLAAADGSGTVRRIELKGAGFYSRLSWSPDARRLAFIDNSLTLYVLEIATGRQTRVAQEPVYSPIPLLAASWSPDSRWLAYALNDHGLIRAAFLYSIEQDRSYRITDGLAEIDEPVFDPAGKFLYMLRSVEAGPLKDWFAQSNLDAPLRRTVIALTLAKDGPSAIPPESDELTPPDGDGSAKSKTAGTPGKESGKNEGSEKQQRASGKQAGAKADEESDGRKPPPPTQIDLDGLGQRVATLPIEAATLHNLRAAEGRIYYLVGTGRAGLDVWGGLDELVSFSFTERETKSFADQVAGFELDPSGKKLLVAKADGFFVANGDAPLEAGKGRLPVGAIAIEIDPRTEWQQIFDEAWRINRDYFYAPNYHGADWDAVKRKYQPLVAHAATRADVEKLIVAMASELSVGHSYSSPGESIDDPQEQTGGLLGADYAAVGSRYRIARIYGARDGSDEQRSPLRAPGVQVEAGQFLLAIDGHDLVVPEEIDRWLVGKAGKQVRLRVATSADGQAAREVTVVPIESEAELRYRDWVEQNLATVDRLTGGRVAYVHVPDTAAAGFREFKRYFYPQTHKQALILDERYNHGGLFSDYYIDLLRRPFVAHWAMRYGADLASPRGAIFGPKVMLIDETAGSGGDLLPYMFRTQGLGPLVGKRTWGGLVGILGYPELLDGGQVTAPNFAIWNQDGWIVENQGVAPDIEVEWTPADWAAGRDPQLERAIEVVLKALEQQPARIPQERPAWPQRARPSAR